MNTDPITTMAKAMEPAIATESSTMQTYSMTDMEEAPVTPEEFNDAEYCRDVLQLSDGRTEAIVDEELATPAATLGLEYAQSRLGHDLLDEGDSTVTIDSRHARTDSMLSAASASTSLTSTSSTDDTYKPIQLRRTPSFSEYEQMLAQTSLVQCPPKTLRSTPSLLSIGSRSSYSSFKDGIKNRFKLRKSKAATELSHSCVCCREDFKIKRGLYTLPCLHKYCDKCLRVLIQQAQHDESSMPPKCCGRALPSSVVKTVLTADEQDRFLQAVLQYSTPWESRMFCPSPTCGAFIPPITKVDHRHPFTVICSSCGKSACSICKRAAHEAGRDCPADHELEAVLKLGETAGWRRCYKCRTLVELTQGCSHITCRCKAQFCYLCGAVWDPDIGCPNYCSGEEELERRQIEEEMRLAARAEELALHGAQEIERAANLLAARARSLACPAMLDLQVVQEDEMARFLGFERKMKWIMWTRHGQAKLDVLDQFGELQVKMRERHLKTAGHLEDRQVAAEMEMRATLQQTEKSVQIRLKHMEAYCDGLGRSIDSGGARVVTERDLRELGQQYNIRDDLDRLHQARINVMRDKQAKQMESLLARQDEEMTRSQEKQDEELDALEELFGLEEARFYDLFVERKERLVRRWDVQEELCRRKVQDETGLEHARLDPIAWPAPVARTDGLEAVIE